MQLTTHRNKYFSEKKNQGILYNFLAYRHYSMPIGKKKLKIDNNAPSNNDGVKAAL